MKFYILRLYHNLKCAFLQLSLIRNEFYKMGVVHIPDSRSSDEAERISAQWNISRFPVIFCTNVDLKSKSIKSQSPKGKFIAEVRKEWMKMEISGLNNASSMIQALEKCKIRLDYKTLFEATMSNLAE